MARDPLIGVKTMAVGFILSVFSFVLRVALGRDEFLLGVWLGWLILLVGFFVNVSVVLRRRAESMERAEEE